MKTRGRETARVRELGKERGSGHEKMIQPASKLLNVHKETKGRKSNLYTSKIIVKSALKLFKSKG